MAFVTLKLVVALFPGPAQLSDTCSINNDGKLGGAWERAQLAALFLQYSTHATGHKVAHVISIVMNMTLLTDLTGCIL